MDSGKHKTLRSLALLNFLAIYIKGIPSRYEHKGCQNQNRQNIAHVIHSAVLQKKRVVNVLVRNYVSDKIMIKISSYSRFEFRSILWNLRLQLGSFSFRNRNILHLSFEKDAEMVLPETFGALTFSFSFSIHTICSQTAERFVHLNMSCCRH